jgi:hypothetical protein
MKIGQHEVKVLSKSVVKVGCQEVTRNQLNELLILLDNYVEPPTFKSGEFVKVVSENKHKDSHKFVGKYGKIGLYDDKSCSYEVEFAEPCANIVGYETAKPHHWWFSPTSLQSADKTVVKKEPPFKVGDRVRYTQGTSEHPVGSVGVVQGLVECYAPTFADGGIRVRFDDGTSEACGAFRLEKFPFKVGDKVTSADKGWRFGETGVVEKLERDGDHVFVRFSDHTASWSRSGNLVIDN